MVVNASFDLFAVFQEFAEAKMSKLWFGDFFSI